MKTQGEPNTEWESRLGYPELCVVGIDEVGRGCLAGPVVAGAVVLPSSSVSMNRDTHPWLHQVHDSKLLSPSVREELDPLIRNWALACSIGVASVEEIDRVNIFHASHLAMVRAVEGLGIAVAHVLVDGKFAPKNLPCPATAIVKGDQKCLSIACASIIAKVWRDRLMSEMEARYPGYGFGGHKGYSTPVHQKALRELGPCEIHRRSFSPVADAIRRMSEQVTSENQMDLF